MDKIKQIGFKAGEKPRRPVIQADTSASKSYASIAYGISEGEIVGLVDGAKSIILDGTPVMSSSGDLNIPDVTIQERKGTNDQTHLEGFPAVVNEKQYNNIEMLFSTPFVHYINDTNLDAVGIRFTFGALQRTDPDDGDVSGITIEYAIDVQVDGQGYQELLRTNIVGKYSAGYQRYHRVELPPAEEGWEVRIRRLSPNTTSTYIADKMYLDAVAEILDVKMRYPNTALIGLKFDSERFSNIPKVDFRMRGKIIRVPANYDPVNRTYAQSGEGTTNGIWNGQFKMAYTTNPAWIFYDLVLNKRYGLGNRIDPSMLDKWSLYSIAQYCDVMVPDGEGGLEPRFTCNVYINNRFEAYDCLMQLAGVFRGIMYWSGTAIIAGCDRPQDPVFTYTRANIIGEFNYSGTRTRDRHSVVMVSFDDPKNNYKTDKEVVSDRKAISEIGVRTKDLAAFACTSRGQAQRAGKWALFKEQLETRIVTFALGMDGYIAPVGRVIEIADPLLAGRAVGGRIAAVSSDKKTITLDRDTEVKVGDRLVLNNEEGEQESRQVASVTGRNITVSVAFDSPAVEHVWAVDSDDLQLMRFTVISVTENRSQDSINFTVTALQHEPALHEVADYSAYIERNNYSVIDITTQKAPAEVLISSNNRINQGIDITDLVISWKQAENAVKYHVQWRRDDGNWIQMPFQYGNQVTIENIYHGVYEAKVVAINAAEVNSLPASSLPTPINSKFAEPATLASLTATGILFGIELNWKFPLYGAQNAAYVEIYWAINADKGDEKLLGSYAYPTTETTLNGLSPHQTIHFRARLVDRNGIASGFTAWVTATVVADPDKLLDILNGHIGLAAIDAELAQAIDDNTTGVAEAKALANQALVDANNSASDASAAADAVAQEAIDRAAAMTAQSDALMADSAAKVKALKDEVDPKILTLQNGITQVTTDYKAGDTAVVGQLNAYKTSNDSAVASVLQKAESAVSTGATNSSAITAINGQIATINNTKLDASVIAGYYTKGQTDAKAAEIAAGKVEEFNASLSIGTENLITQALWKSPAFSTVNKADRYEFKLVKSESPYTTWAQFGPWGNIQEGTKMVLSFKIKALDSTPLTVGGHTSGITYDGSGAVVYLDGVLVQNTDFHTGSTTIPNDGKYHLVVVLMTKSGTGNDYVYIQPNRPTSYNQPVNCSIKEVMLSVGTAYVEWDAPKEFIQNQLNANSTAIQNTNAEVTRVDNRVTAANNATTALSGRVSTVEGAVSTKAEAAALTALTTRITDAEGVNTSQGSAITTLQNTVNHATTGLATKASSSPLTIVDNKVTAANGRIDTTNSNLTTLTGRVDTVEGVVSTKADATALTNLTTRVTNAEGVNTSQGTAITDLQNTVNHATTGLSTKASTSALNLTNSEVTRIDGAVSGHTNQLTQLTSDINTINGTLATKANASALNDIYTKSQTDAKATEIAAGQITAFEATLALGGGWMDIGREGAQLAVERGAGTIEVLDRTLNHFKTTATSDGGFSVYIGACNNSSAIPVGTPYVMTGKVRASRANLYDRIYSRFNQYTSESYVYGWNASSDWVSFKASGVTNTQDQHPLHNIIGAYVPWAIAGDWVEFKDCRIAINSDSVTSANANAIQNTNAEVSRVDGRVTTESNRITTLAGRVSTVEGSKADASALNSLTSRVEAEEGKSTSQGTAITNLENTINSPTTGLATKASAQALTTLNNQVQHSTTGLSAVNTKVDTLKATVESTTSGLPSKASSAALDTLSNKVNHSTTGLDAIANKTTALESNVDSALKAVTISDTRSDNQPPSWYWTNYRHRRVTEFKFNTAIGVSSFFGGTYCYLETVVPWSDSSGGHLIQTATSANDPSLYVQRTSTSTSAWSAWAQPIKDLRDGLTAKASASALNSLTTRVTTAEGTISSEATKLSNLTTTVGGHTTSIATQTSTIDGIQAKHTVKINNNGFVTGYGLISTANNGAVVSAFKVDADAFAVGKSGSGILPFVVTTAGQTINGIRYPEAGTWINSAYIASATIGTAHINDLAVTTAKIGDGQITTAKIGDAQITSAKIGNAEVKTLKIDGEAVTAVSSVVYATYVCAKTYTINNQLTAAILAMKPDYPSTVKGLLIGTPFANITVNPEGGGVQVDISTNAMWESRVDGGAGGTFIYYIAVFLSGQLKVAQIDFIGNTSIPGQDNPAQARANSFVRFIFKGIPNGAKVEAYYAVAFAQTPNLYVMKARDLTVTVTSVKR